MIITEPRTNVKFDVESYGRVRRNIKFRAKAKRGRKTDPRFSLDLPDDIGMQINRACNLRCKTCFLWNDQGRYKDLPRDLSQVELEPEYFEKILIETDPAHSNIFMWGTEPLYHSAWDEYSRLLQEHPRWTVVCTNGLLIEKQMETLLPISENLVLDISVDGLAEEHNKIRGKKTFERTMRNIELLRDLQDAGEYKGLVSMHCVLSDELIPRMKEFAEMAEDLRINTLYFGIPWYISPQTANEMDEFFAEKLPFIDLKYEGTKPSWHQYTWHLSPESIPALQEGFQKLCEKTWDIRIRLQPSVQPHELEDYVLGGKMPAQNKTQCLGTSTRLDVLASGDITVCQSFPEFRAGNIKEQGLVEIWKGEKYNQVREVINQGLTPICSKCIILYLNGV
ncbi:MAG: radical SAM protein [Cytophagales bacterium]|nr:radical SAM protein [Cytophagales bacterium]